MRSPRCKASVVSLARSGLVAACSGRNHGNYLFVQIIGLLYGDLNFLRLFRTKWVDDLLHNSGQRNDGLVAVNVGSVAFTVGVTVVG